MHVKLEHIYLSYKDGGNKRDILKDFSMEIPSGEFLMVVGPSGCGKSTLLNIIGGLQTPDQGRVILEDVDYGMLSKKQKDQFRRNHIGYVFQSFYLVEDMSPLDNVEMMMPSHYKKAEKQKKAAEVIERLGIGEKMQSRLNTFSGGEKQRLAIARAIAQESSLLICDEPTGNLDDQNTHQVMGLLKSLNNEGITVIMVTHNRELVSYASRVLDFGTM